MSSSRARCPNGLPRQRRTRPPRARATTVPLGSDANSHARVVPPGDASASAMQARSADTFTGGSTHEPPGAPGAAPASPASASLACGARYQSRPPRLPTSSTSPPLPPSSPPARSASAPPALHGWPPPSSRPLADNAGPQPPPEAAAAVAVAAAAAARAFFLAARSAAIRAGFRHVSCSQPCVPRAASAAPPRHGSHGEPAGS